MIHSSVSQRFVRFTVVRPNRKIPTACKSFGIDAVSLMEMLKREFPKDF